MDDYLTTEQLADMLNIKKNSLEVARTQRRSQIPFTRWGRRVLYKRSDVIDFLERNKVKNPVSSDEAS